MQTGNVNFNLGSLWYCKSLFSFSFSLVRTESECYNYIYHFHKGSLADWIGHFLNTVLWKKFSMKRNIYPVGTSHTYVRKMNRLLSNLWSVKAVNCWHEAIHNVLTQQIIRRQLNIRRDNMDLLTHFCIASSKRDYEKHWRSRAGDTGELGARSEPLLFAKKKKKKNHKILIIFIVYSFWRMANNSFFTYEFGTLKGLNTHLNRLCVK